MPHGRKHQHSRNRAIADVGHGLPGGAHPRLEGVSFKAGQAVPDPYIRLRCAHWGLLYLDATQPSDARQSGNPRAILGFYYYLLRLGLVMVCSDTFMEHPWSTTTFPLGR